MLSRQLSTQPLPAAPMSIGYCGRNHRFSSLLSVLNNHSNSIKSHERLPLSAARKQHLSSATPSSGDTPQRPGKTLEQGAMGECHRDSYIALCGNGRSSVSRRGRSQSVVPCVGLVCRCAGAEPRYRPRPCSVSGEMARQVAAPRPCGRQSTGPAA